MIQSCIAACEAISHRVAPNTHRISDDVTVDIRIFHSNTVLICFDLPDYSHLLTIGEKDGMYSSVRDTIKPIIPRIGDMVRNAEVVILTGFGMGGACAIMASCMLRHRCLNLITFGAPSSVDESRAGWLRDRLVTCTQYQGYYDPKRLWPYGFSHITSNILNCGATLASYAACLKNGL